MFIEPAIHAKVLIVRRVDQVIVLTSLKVAELSVYPRREFHQREPGAYVEADPYPQYLDRLCERDLGRVDTYAGLKRELSEILMEQVAV